VPCPPRSPGAAVPTKFRLLWSRCTSLELRRHEAASRGGWRCRLRITRGDGGMNGAAEKDPVEEGAGVDDEMDSRGAGVKRRAERISRGQAAQLGGLRRRIPPKAVLDQMGGTKLQDGGPLEIRPPDLLLMVSSSGSAPSRRPRKGSLQNIGYKERRPSRAESPRPGDCRDRDSVDQVLQRFRNARAAAGSGRSASASDMSEASAV